jgi:hypothetical protein
MPNWDEPGVRYDDRRTYDEVLNQEKKITTMFDIVLDVRGLTGPELIQRAKNIAAGVTSEAVFALLAADVTALNTMITSAEALQAAKATREAAYRNAVAACDDSDDEIAAALKVIGSKVGTTATTEAQITAAKLRVKGKPAPKPVPGQVSNVVLSFGDEEGELDASWDGVDAADWYQSRWTADDPSSPTAKWHMLSTVKKSSLNLSALPSGQKVWFQVQAANARGQGPWSDPACKRVP